MLTIIAGSGVSLFEDGRSGVGLQPQMKEQQMKFVKIAGSLLRVHARVGHGHHGDRLGVATLVSVLSR